MTIDGILRDVYNTPMMESTLLDAQITLIDTLANATTSSADGNAGGSLIAPINIDDVWREIVSGERREYKEEALDEMMTLEDFLAKAETMKDDDVKMAVPSTEPFSDGVSGFDHVPSSLFPSLDKVEASEIGFGNGVEGIGTGGGGWRRKRGCPVLEQLDMAAQQRQKRMIKNRESAARSRERKQAYKVELENLVVRLKEENEQLMKEKAESSKERYKQLMDKIIPVVEKRMPPRALRRVRSSQW